jgi:hypothetical protein
MDVQFFKRQLWCFIEHRRDPTRARIHLDLAGQLHVNPILIGTDLNRHPEHLTRSRIIRRLGSQEHRTTHRMIQ